MCYNNLKRMVRRFFNEVWRRYAYVKNGAGVLMLNNLLTFAALINLLKNAIEHTPEGGTVTITAAGSNLSTEITITDTGERQYKTGRCSAIEPSACFVFAYQLTASDFGIHGSRTTTGTCISSERSSSAGGVTKSGTVTQATGSSMR